MNAKRNFLSLLVLLMIFSGKSFAQTVPQGITYQGIARNTSGNIIPAQAIGIRLSIYTPVVGGTLEWEEEHHLTTNQYGLFSLVIGQGTSTGAGSATTFSAIHWESGTHLVKIALDETGGSSYTDIDTVQFWSVPYAMYAGSAASVSQNYRLNQLTDVDTTGAFTGAVLKWNGSIWLPAADNDSDTASFAYNAQHAQTADTSMYAWHLLSPIDTVLFSHYSDTAAYALNAPYAANATHATHSDTAAYALSSGSSFTYWNLTGNTGTSATSNFVGTTDNNDLVFRTNNTERMRVTAGGKIGVGVAAPTASLQITGDDGMIQTGTFGAGTILSLGAGSRFHWYSRKSAFRAGGVTSTQWDDGSIGIYSFASGNNNIGSGAYSISAGQSNTAGGIYSVAMGYGCVTNGYGAVAMGSACNANGAYSIALARGCVASDSGAVCIGYHSNATGKFSQAFGGMTNATGNYSTTMGWYANTNNKVGSFVYADASSTSPTLSTADNQFMVRASGGIIFYSNSGMTNGVSLPAGGGSWASVSDRNKKEHFRNIHPDEILEKLAQLEVTSWNYKSQPASIRHLGPMAQDFHRLFGLGENDTTISTIDIDGINLVAIQALAGKTEELRKKSEEVKELKATIEKLLKEKESMEKRMSEIETKLGINTAVSDLNH